MNPKRCLIALACTRGMVKRRKKEFDVGCGTAACTAQKTIHRWLGCIHQVNCTRRNDALRSLTASCASQHCYCHDCVLREYATRTPPYEAERMILPSASVGGGRYVLLDLEVRYQLIHANPMLRLCLQTLLFGDATPNYHAILVPHGAGFCPAPRPDS